MNFRTRARRIAAGVIGGGVMIGLGACASVPPPFAAMQNGSVALAQASDAGAAAFAPAELQAATTKYEQARQAFDKKAWRLAEVLAQQAEVDAQLAEKRARTAKAQQAASLLREDIRRLSVELQRNPVN